ncbi:MAG TPA: protein-L-isoaspartate(D-aspartate) O-methyltransferase [Gemmatimonadaceae bacterium]|jgi:protein-L-isoaspartate(D-aspartate) O-methyltransferase|nr:protein-L-isoaspartate(D-aspartate) O-methyltransferase [Gemmatimonadaceae bacterium]
MVATVVEQEFRGPRRRLVEQLHDQGIRDLAVLNAIDQTPRHRFIPTGIRHRAYEDSALPIGNGQTISQPSIHARYLELLKLTGNEKILEIGTGSGYQTALLSVLASQVFSIERIPELLDNARDTIRQLGLRNISFLLGDGTLGWRQYAPYDAILVGAGAPEVPSPYLEQLKEGGRVLIPLGDKEEQTLYMFTRRGDELQQVEVAPVRFVPLVGKYSWEGM